MDYFTINLEKTGIKLIKIVGGVFLTFGITGVLAAIFYAASQRYFEEAEATLIVYSISGLIFSIFIYALCINVAKINDNLQVLRSIKEYELEKSGLRLDIKE